MMSLTLLLAGLVGGLLVMGVVIAVIVVWAQNRQIGEEIDRNPDPPRPVGLERAPVSLEEQVSSLVRAGNKLEAIKRYREASGVGLKEAKDAVEALGRGEPLLAPARLSWNAQALPNDLEAEVRALTLDGNKLAAITRYRAATGASLLEAKNAVEAVEHGQALPRLGALPNDELPPTVMTSLEEQVANLLRQDRKLDAIKIYRAATNLGLAEAKAAVEAIERSLLG